MLDLIPRLTPEASTGPDSTPSPGPSVGWPGRLAAWLGPASAALLARGPGGGPGDESALAELAEVAAVAREPDEIRVALVRLAARVAGAARAELLEERGGHLARRLACWPVGQHHSALAGRPSAPRGPIAGSARAKHGPEAPPLLIPLQAGDSNFGTLRLVADHADAGPPAWPDPVVRRLRALCAVAAVAERALALTALARPTLDPVGDPVGDPEVGPRGSAILGAFLGFALAQARRRHEPLSLLDVAVDRLAALKALMGDELGESAVDRAARAIKGTVRASDVIARLEDGRLVVILPNAGAVDAARVAEGVRAAIARAGSASATMPGLTASIGVATYPEQARDCPTLRAAASSARARAEAGGADRVASAPISD